jgi:hypothetical protein
MYSQFGGISRKATQSCKTGWRKLASSSERETILRSEASTVFRMAQYAHKPDTSFYLVGQR